jgi:hypothetical protein
MNMNTKFMLVSLDKVQGSVTDAVGIEHDGEPSVILGLVQIPQLLLDCSQLGERLHQLRILQE